jgi:hypothetical protein
VHTGVKSGFDCKTVWTTEGSGRGILTFWVREEDTPAVAYPLVELDRALGSFGLEVWGSTTETETVREEISTFTCGDT